MKWKKSFWMFAKEDSVLILKLFFSENELEIAEEIIEWLHKNLLERIQKKNEPMLIHGFVTSVNDSGKMRLIWCSDQHFLFVLLSVSLIKKWLDN